MKKNLGMKYDFLETSSGMSKVYCDMWFSTKPIKCSPFLRFIPLHLKKKMEKSTKVTSQY